MSVPYGLLALLGIRPSVIENARALNLIYQFWIHTEAVRSIGPLEKVLNTPSHHRVHHGSNRQYLDRNHGSILIVWDRLFGTFERRGRAGRLRADDEHRDRTTRCGSPPTSGGTSAPTSPRAETWRERWSFLLRGPGWAYAVARRAALAAPADPSHRRADRRRPHGLTTERTTATRSAAAETIGGYTRAAPVCRAEPEGDPAGEGQQPDDEKRPHRDQLDRAEGDATGARVPARRSDQDEHPHRDVDAEPRPGADGVGERTACRAPLGSASSGQPERGWRSPRPMSGSSSAGCGWPSSRDGGSGYPADRRAAAPPAGAGPGRARGGRRPGWAG